jgi:hypothetical protein
MKKTWIYNTYGTEFYIDKSTGDFWQKRKWESDFKLIKASIMDEMLDAYKGMNKIYQPFTVLIYRAWKNWQISKYKWFLVSNQ